MEIPADATRKKESGEETLEKKKKRVDLNPTPFNQGNEGEGEKRGKKIYFLVAGRGERKRREKAGRDGERGKEKKKGGRKKNQSPSMPCFS